MAAEPDQVPHLSDDLPFEVKVHTWPCLRHLDSTAVRCMPYCEQDRADADDFDDFLNSVTPFLVLDVRQEFIFLMFPGLGQASLREIFDNLHLATQEKSATLCVGRPPASQDVWVLCRFGNYRKIAIEDLSVRNIFPSCYRAAISHLNPRERPGRMLEIFETFIQSLRTCGGDLALVASEAEWIAEALESIIQGLSDAQLERLHIDAQLADKNKRATFQDALMKAYIGLLKLRGHEIENRDKSAVVRLGGPLDPRLKLSDLINLQQTVSRLNEITGETETYSLESFVRDPQLFLAYGLLIIGSDTTTGYGKSLSALVIGLYWVRRFLAAGLLPKDRAYVLLQNTIDAMRDSQEQQHAYVPIILDEFKPADQEQNQYCSAEILKSLANVSKGRDLRARHRQVRIFANQPVIMTANGADEQAWCGSRFEWTQPCARRIYVLQITEPLVSDKVRRLGPCGANTEAQDLLAAHMFDD